MNIFSNGWSEYDRSFFYQIIMEKTRVMGALLTIDSRGVLAKKIKTHEQIDSLKTNNFQMEFSNNTPQSSPIILGVFSLDFDQIVNNFKINKNAINVTKQEKVWLIGDECKTSILKILHAERELFLVDGHHRLNALHTLRKPIVAWVVSMDKLFITSFIKIYRCKNINQFMLKLNKRFKICGRPNLNMDNQDKKIHVYFNACLYQLQINNTLSFVDQLCDFDSTLIQENLELHTAVEYHPKQLESLIQTYKTDYIITTHTALNHDEIMHHKLMPIHTTCFTPKPAENSLLLLKNLSC